MKKIVTLLATCTLIILLAGCGNKITSKNNDIYKVDVTKVTSDDGDWIVEGTTKAPDGSRIIATSPSDMATGENTATAEDDSSVKVEDGKFTTHIDPIDVMDTDNAKKGKKAKLYLFAVTNYKKKNDDMIPKRLLKTYKSNFDLIDLSLSSKQAKYFNDLGSDVDKDTDESINTESDSSESSSTNQSDDTNSNFEKATKFESQLNTSIEKSHGAISDVKCDIDPTTGGIKSVTFVVDDSILDAPDSDIQKVKSEADSAVSTVANKYNLSSTPKTYIKTQSGESVE